MSENTEVQKPAKKSFMDRAWSYLAAATVGIGCVGVMAFTHNQISLAVNNHITKSPTYRQTSDGAVGCVIYLSQASCFAVPEEPMPEPVMELSYEDAARLLKGAMAKPTT